MSADAINFNRARSVHPLPLHSVNTNCPVADIYSLSLIHQLTTRLSTASPFSPASFNGIWLFHFSVLFASPPATIPTMGPLDHLNYVHGLGIFLRLWGRVLRRFSFFYFSMRAASGLVDGHCVFLSGK